MDTNQLILSHLCMTFSPSWNVEDCVSWNRVGLDEWKELYLWLFSLYASTSTTGIMTIANFLVVEQLISTLKVRSNPKFSFPRKIIVGSIPLEREKNKKLPYLLKFHFFFFECHQNKNKVPFFTCRRKAREKVDKTKVKECMI